MKKPATNDPSPTKPSNDKGVEFDGAPTHPRSPFALADVLSADDSDEQEAIVACDAFSLEGVCENANGANNRANNTSIRATLMRFSETVKISHRRWLFLLYGADHVVAIHSLPE